VGGGLGLVGARLRRVLVGGSCGFLGVGVVGFWLFPDFFDVFLWYLVGTEVL